MSVVNKMLQDLESRQDADNFEADYTPQANAKRTRNLVLFIVAIMLIAISYFTMRAIGFDKVEQQSRQWLTSIGLMESDDNSAASAQPKVSVNQALEQIMPSKPSQPTPQPATTETVKKPETVELADVLSDEMNEAMGNKPKSSQETKASTEPVTKVAMIPDEKQQVADITEDTESVQSEFTVSVAENTPEQQAEYLREQARQALADGKELEAIDTLKSLQTLLPEDTRVRKRLASLLYANGAANEAQELLQQGLRLSKDAHDLRLMLARVYFQQKQHQQAFNLLDKVQPEIELYPDFYSFKASLAQELKLNQQAYLNYQKLVAYEPHKAKWWLGDGYRPGQTECVPTGLACLSASRRVTTVVEFCTELCKTTYRSVRGDSMKPKLRMRLGDLLVHENIIDQVQLQQALDSQKQTGRKLGHTLIDLGLVTETQLLTFLSQQLDVPLIDISQLKLNANVVKLLPEVQARRYRAIVLEDNPDHVLLGMSDPADLSALDALSNLLPKAVKIAVVRKTQLLNAFDTNYRRTEDIASFAHELRLSMRMRKNLIFSSGATEEDTTVAKLLQSIFEDAVQMSASDIHIEQMKVPCGYAKG